MLKSIPVEDHSAAYYRLADLNHRKRLGQFFTDARIARCMVRWALASGAAGLFDPAFGLGAFYQAMLDLDAPVAFSGCEIDPLVMGFWRAQAGETPGLTILQGDYLQTWGAVHPAIVCNPPYLRFQLFLQRREVAAAFEEQLGIKLPGHTNLASAFLLKSLSELPPGGRLAYILPFEFLDTGYGTLVKAQLLAQGRLHALIRLDCEKDAFPDVITTLGIVLFEKGAAPAQVRFDVLRSLDALERLLDGPPLRAIPQTALDPSAKWQPHFQPVRLSAGGAALVPLHTYGAFSRGIAAGANRFFVLRPSQAAGLGLSPRETVRCITRSAQLCGPVFSEQDFEALAAKDAPVYLLNLGGELSPAAAAYVRLGETQGWHLRYLTRMRSPWYRLEHRSPAPILFGVFSRSGYRVVRNRSQVLNLTCCHGFQPNAAGQPYVDLLYLYLLSAAGREILARNRRQYGQALDKFEPNDLNQALAPAPAWLDRLNSPAVSAELAQVAHSGGLSDPFEALFAELPAGE